jgi:regulator of RNase E activity RraA
MTSLTDTELAALRAIDTPTVCNALEVLAPGRRGSSFTVHPFVCPRPELGPMVGYARTATIRSMQPSNRSAMEVNQARMAYYDHIASGRRPTITVIEDLDPLPGFGAWWGEVNTNVHLGLGSIGAITNGSVRDLDGNADGFGLLAGAVAPSHAWARVEEAAITVTVHGMTVRPGDLIHADRHGAVVVPVAVARRLPDVAASLTERERVLIEASRHPDFGPARLRELLGGRPDH